MKSLIVALAAFAAAPAMAAYEARSSITDVNISFADLVPDDGVDAVSVVRSWNGVYAATGFDGQEHSQYLVDDTQFNFSTAGTSISGTASHDAFSTTLWPDSGPFPRWSIGSAGGAYADVWLATNASITISGWFRASSSCVGRCSEQAVSKAISRARIMDESGDWLASDAVWLDGPGEQADERRFQITYENRSGQGMSLGVHFTAITDMSPIPAVPEPSTYVLMLGGLAAVGGLARARSKGRTSA